MHGIWTAFGKINCIFGNKIGEFDRICMALIQKIGFKNLRLSRIFLNFIIFDEISWLYYRNIV